MLWKKPVGFFLLSAFLYVHRLHTQDFLLQLPPETDCNYDGSVLFRLEATLEQAQNLDYEVPDSWCYRNDEGNCRKYGDKSWEPDTV